MSAARPVAPAPRRPQPSAARPAAVAPKSITLRSVEARIVALEKAAAATARRLDEVRASQRELAATVAQAKARRTR